MPKFNFRQAAPQNLTDALNLSLEDLLRQRKDLAAGLELIGSNIFQGPFGDHVKAERIQNEVLHVSAADPHWAAAVSEMQAELLHEIQKFAPEVKGLAFQSDQPRRVPKNNDSLQARPRQPVPSHSIEEALSRLLDASPGKSVDPPCSDPNLGFDKTVPVDN